MARPYDTSPESFERQLEALRRMGPEERLRRGLELSDELRDITKAGIRRRHPEFSDAQVRAAFEVLILGPDRSVAARRSRLASTR